MVGWGGGLGVPEASGFRSHPTKANRTKKIKHFIRNPRIKSTFPIVNRREGFKRVHLRMAVVCARFADVGQNQVCRQQQTHLGRDLTGFSHNGFSVGVEEGFFRCNKPSNHPRQKGHRCHIHASNVSNNLVGGHSAGLLFGRSNALLQVKGIEPSFGWCKVAACGEIRC